MLGLALKDGQLPRGLQDGDHVAIYQVSDAQQTCPGGSGGLLAADALVLAIGAPAAASGSQAQADVEVAVNPADATQVACNAANSVVAWRCCPAGPPPPRRPGPAADRLPGPPGRFRVADARRRDWVTWR